MPKALPLKKEKQTVRHELTAEELIHQARKIMEIKEKVMQRDVHFGIIPGFKKPSLLKPGAEKLCTAFRLEPEFETSSRDDPNRTITWEKWDHTGKKKIEGTTQGYIEYDSTCTLVHIPTGEIWARRVSGSCNNFEAKYRSLNPYDVKNTLEKMAEKRALVAAVLIGTAASDQFTQDIETMPYLINGEGQGTSVEGSPKVEKPKVEKPKVEKPDDDSVRMATPKQVAYIKGQLKKYNIAQDDFFRVWGEDFETWEDIPFHRVNAILQWIREQ